MMTMTIACRTCAQEFPTKIDHQGGPIATVCAECSAVDNTPQQDRLAERESLVARARRCFGLAAVPDAFTSTALSDELRLPMLMGARVIADHAKDPSKPTAGIALSGATGVGKTHAAVTCLAEAVEFGLPVHQVLMGTESDLLGPRPGSFNQVDVDAAVGGYRVILIDDFGRANFGGRLGDGTSIRMKFFDLVAARDVSLIVTTNLAPNQLDTALDPAVSSRLRQYVGQPLVLTGDDRRQAMSRASHWTPGR